MSTPVVIDDPDFTAAWLRRAAVACRNLAADTNNSNWFSWVPDHLERLANRLDHLGVESAGE